MTVFDTIKSGIASAGDPFKQFHGVGFEQSSLAKLSPVWEKVCLFNTAHLSLFIERTQRASSSLFVSDYIASGHLFLGSERYPDDGISNTILA
jgi:hypothetical protein